MKRPFQRVSFRGAIASTALALGAATIGVMPPAASAAEADRIVLNIMDINDFHGRIDANTVKFAGTIEQLRARDGAGGSNSLFISSGDNIGASLFASASQQDMPTIDVLNALELKTSAVGNHEFDQGYDDLAGRVSDASDFSYLGANVYEKGTTTPALDEYDVFNVGNLVANALRDSVADQPAGADIGVVNPGGLRSDLLYAGSTGDDADVNKDGVITYAEANAVLPFTNNLYSVSMTGAQFKNVLEQQWQRTAGGEIPSRNYLQLGLSDNARYTFDSQAPEGERIIDVIVDGKPIDEDATYKIATFSFLATGGDNFHEFKNAPSVDTGLVDREAWIDYLGNETPVSPSFARRAVEVNDLRESVSLGSTLSFNLSQLDLTSLGSPANTKVSSFTMTSSGGQSIDLPGEAAVTNGAAPVDVLIPSTVSPGGYTLTGVATPSGTTFSVPVEVQKADAQIVAGQAPPTRVKANKTKASIQADVTASGFTPAGKVTVYYDGKAVGEASLKKGSAKVRLDKFTTTGTKDLSVVYAGNDDVSSSSTIVTIQVIR